MTVALRSADRTAFREIELDARQTWEAAVAAVPRDSLERPALANGRSVKDLVAHIASWERWGAQRLEATLAGATPTPIGEWAPFEHNFNQVAYEHWRGELWATVAAEASSSYAAFWEKVEALDDEQLFGPRGHARLVRACGSEHYEPYVAQIRALIEDLPPLLSIETSRLRLRSFRPSDAPSLLTVFIDPEVRRFLPPGPTPTLARIRRAIDRQIGGERANGFSLYAVERRDGGELIGNSGLALVDGTGPEIELAYHYGRQWWGPGVRDGGRDGVPAPRVRRSGARARDRDLLSGQRRVAAGHGEGRDDRRGDGPVLRRPDEKVRCRAVDLAGSHIAVSRSAQPPRPIANR